jgi:hypothetical protein
MENAIVALISTALIILSSIIMTTSTLQATTKMAASWQTMDKEFNDMRATSISAETDDYYGGAIEIKVINNGQNNLNAFPKWDVIAQYEGGTATYLEYTPGTSASTNQWAVAGINTGEGEGEIFDPGILNPGEYLRMQIMLSPELIPHASVRITIATPGGIKAQCLVTMKTAP